jgi:outer membrane lipoprotein-sorting protein
MLEMINKFSKREKTILTISIAFVLLAFLDRAILNPIINQMKSFEEEIKQTEYEMTKNSKILKQRQRIEKEEKKYASFIQTAGSEEEETAMLLRAVESLASRTNVYLIDLKPAGIEESADMKKFLINISCEAQMEPMLSFMYAIESSDMLAYISAFNMGPKSRDSDINRCELMLNKIVVK